MKNETSIFEDALIASCKMKNETSIFEDALIASCIDRESMPEALLEIVGKYVTHDHLGKKEHENAASSLEQDLEAIEKINFGVEKAAQTALYLRRLTSVYPHIDPCFLSMRHPKCYGVITHDRGKTKFSLPRFGVFSLETPECTFRLTTEFEWCYDKKILRSLELVNPSLPFAIEDPLLGSIKGSFDETPLDYPYFNDRYTTIFTGIIPSEAKRKIEIAKRAFKDQIYVIAEANNWKAKPEPIADPLVVGVKGDTCFLITSFNTTPFEDYVAREFSYKE